MSTSRGAPILSVRDLTVTIDGASGGASVVDGLTFDVAPGEVLGIVGESGSGKSMTAKAIMGLLPSRARVARGEVVLDGIDLTGLSPEELRTWQGRRLAMVFQNPLTSLNPAFRIGWQLREAVLTHDRGARRTVADRVRDALRAVGIARPEERERSYPHEFSGGMRQRVVIAAGILNEPGLLIADEPTTALDVTIQAQVLELLRELCDEKGLALVLITHNMGVVANMCDRVAVMYAGEIVEIGDVDDVFAAPKHPYTDALLRAMPGMGSVRGGLPAIPGSPPDFSALPTGCRFADRCAFAVAACAQHPALHEVAPAHESRCWVAHAAEGHVPWAS